jgi:hypothetical protein
MIDVDCDRLAMDHHEKSLFGHFMSLPIEAWISEKARIVGTISDLTL